MRAGRERAVGCGVHGRRPAPEHPALRARRRRLARGRDRAAVRRDRRRAARRARRRAARSTWSRSTCREAERRRPLRARARRRSTRGASEGDRDREREPALWALEQELHGARRRSGARGAASSRACAWRTTAPGRIRPHERTHPGPEGGPAAPDARHAGQPLPHLQPLPRPRRRGAARRSRGATGDEPFATATDDDGTDNRSGASATRS